MKKVKSLTRIFKLPLEFKEDLKALKVQKLLKFKSSQDDLHDLFFVFYWNLIKNLFL